MSDQYEDWQDGTVKLVKNADQVCSMWPADRENAPGWSDVGVSGTKQECLDYVNEHCDKNCRLQVDPKIGQ